MQKFSFARLVGIIALFIFSIYSLTAFAAANKKTYLVGFAQDTMANDWRTAQVRELEKEFKKYPDVRFIYTNAKGQTARQIKDIEDLTYQKVDVLITSPRDALLTTPVISKVYKSGIPVVLITRDIRSKDYTSLVAPDDMAIARRAANYMATKMNKKGNILMLRGVATATTAIARTEGFISELKKFPAINVVAIEDGNYLRADAVRAVQSVISQGIQFDAIYAQSDSMASGARLALKKAGIKPRSKMIVGIDYINEARDAIRKGEQAASFLYPTSGKQVVETVMSILQGKPVPRRVTVETQMITRENVEKISPIF